MLKIQEHIKRFGLEKTIEKFKLKCKDLGHKYILKYDQLDSPFGFEEVCESRGLVLAKENFAVLSYPFYKFFTYTETKAVKIDWESATATEKRDGSLIQAYYDFIINKWCINTMFSECEELLRNSEKSLKHLFYEMMDEYKSSFDLFDINNIYVFELTSPLNKVVVNYDESDFRLLMVRNRITLKEYSLEDKIQISKKIKLPFVEIYPFKSLEELTNSFSGKGFNFEGYVVCDKFFNRIKVKNKWGTEKYKTVQHLYEELENSECILSERNGELIRNVQFVGAIIVYKKDGINYRLWEDRAVFNDGRIRIRPIQQSISQKTNSEHILNVRLNF